MQKCPVVIKHSLTFSSSGCRPTRSI